MSGDGHEVPGTRFRVPAYSPGGQGVELPETLHDDLVRRHWSNEEGWLDLLNAGDESLAHAIRAWHSRRVDMTGFARALLAATCRVLPHEEANVDGKRRCLCCLRTIR